METRLTRFAELRRRGVGRELAAKTAGSDHGPCRTSNSSALTIALPNAFFVAIGIASVASDAV
jgi:RNA-directed DNA polymerase